MKFKAQTKAGTLLDWLRAIHAVSDDCIFTTSELDVVEVRAVDPANALMIIMRMPDHVWDSLEVEAGGIGIDVAQLITKVVMFDRSLELTQIGHSMPIRCPVPDSLRIVSFAPMLSKPELSPPTGVFKVSVELTATGLALWRDTDVLEKLPTWFSSGNSPAPILAHLVFKPCAVEYPTADLTITTEHRELRDWLVITDGSATFGLEMLNTEHMRKPPGEPELGDLPVKFIIDAGRLQQAVRRAESVSDNLWIGMDSDGSVRVWTETDHDDYNEHLLTAEVGTSEQVAVRSMFSIDYMRETVAAMRGDVLVQLGQDKSVRMSCLLHGASVTYVQAPRVE